MILWRVWREYRWYYTWPAIWWKRVSLFCRILWRINQADYRTGPALSWEIACHIHSRSDHHSFRGAA